MPVKEVDLHEEQAALEPREDLSPYVGQWVALRDGRVIAHDLELDRLRAHPEVRDDDVIVPVSPARGGYFVA
jgi:hypothetical protein